jgi:LuxR family maltose regulon positive regulatory protein
MPKAAQYTVCWSQAHQAYAVFAQHTSDPLLLCEDETAWFIWLETHSSFSFRGSAATLSFQKERRLRGKDGYWYAYHHQGRRMLKRYIGPSRNLTLAQLETLARAGGSQTPRICSPHPAGMLPQARPHDADVPIDPTKARAEASFVHHPPVLLLAKLRPPRLSAQLIPRGRLYPLLESGLERRLTLVTAPAGYGKTTLLTQWVTDSASSAHLLPVAWVSLEGEDNDPVRFWHTQ